MRRRAKNQYVSATAAGAKRPHLGCGVTDRSPSNILDAWRVSMPPRALSGNARADAASGIRYPEPAEAGHRMPMDQLKTDAALSAAHMVRRTVFHCCYYFDLRSCCKRYRRGIRDLAEPPSKTKRWELTNDQAPSVHLFAWRYGGMNSGGARAADDKDAAHTAKRPHGSLSRAASYQNCRICAGSVLVE